MGRRIIGSHVLLRRPWLLLGGALICILVALAIGAPMFAPHDPLKQNRDGLVLGGAPAPPGRRYVLGADSRGRDVLSRLLHGARLSLAVGLGGTAVAMALALGVGVSAGFFGGTADRFLMRCTDIVMAFPAILLAVALAAALPQRNVVTLVLVVGFLNWAAPARVFRSETLTLRERLYVEAARSLGAGEFRTLVRHVLPHLAPTALVLARLATASTVLLAAGLSFLGVGIPAPAPTWGSMLHEAQTWYSVAPWLAFWPGAAVVVTVAAFNLIAFDLSRPGRAGEPR